MIYSFILELAGLLLIYLEFFLPGGIMAIGGGLMLLLGLSLFAWVQPYLGPIIAYVVILILLVIAVCRGAMWQIRRKQQTLYLSDDQAGYMASTFDVSLIGQKAISLTELKPSGHILVEGKQFQAVCEMGYVPKDTALVIVSGKGSYFIVKEA